jgi:DNA polymerase III alpha subunit
MRLDRFSNPIYNEQDIFKALYQGHKDILTKATVDISLEIEKLSTVSHAHLLTPLELDDSFSIEDFDQAMQSDWFMPDEYKTFDIETWISEQCNTDKEMQRAQEELVLFRQYNMIMLLRWLKYFVDTMDKNNMVWGVGRGSSVASYVLYLIGVHSINSIKYNLDYREFLR